MLPILVFLVLLAIYQNSFSKGRFTCKNFLLNAYLYIFLSFLITAVSVQMYDYFQVPSLPDIYRKNGFIVLSIFLMMIGLLILVMSWPAQKVIQKHFLWVLWVALIGYTLYPLFQKSPQIYEQATILTFMMMAVFYIGMMLMNQLIIILWFHLVKFGKLNFMIIYLAQMLVLELVVHGNGMSQG